MMHTRDFEPDVVEQAIKELKEEEERANIERCKKLIKSKKILIEKIKAALPFKIVRVERNKNV